MPESDSNPLRASSISPRVWAVTGIPLLLLVLASGMLLFQVVRLERAVRWLEHSEEAIALCVKTERNLRAEQAARTQQWLTGEDDGRALGAASEYALSLRDLRAHFSDNSHQLDQVDVIEASYRAWQRFSANLEVTGDSEFEKRIQSSEKLVEQVVAAIRELEREERRLRRIRAAHVDDMVSLLTYAALPTLLLLALAIGVNARREVFRLAQDFNEAMTGRQRANRELELQSWVREQLRQLGVSREDAGFRSLGDRALESLLTATGAVVGSVFVAVDEHLERCAARGVTASAPARLVRGEGLLGEAAMTGELRYLDALPADYLKIESSLGSAPATHLALVPCVYRGEVNAVIELGFLEPPSERARMLLDQTGTALGMAFAVTSKKVRLQDLLGESRQQAEALQLQQEELRVANEELSSQSDALKAAQLQLEARKSELERSNQELIKQRNALDETRQQLEARAMELRRANRYKNEFLASMSHELRTPLNSILILSKSLAQGDPSRFTPEELKYAETIHASGNDLLALINDVLEISKIEAGAVEPNFTSTTVSDVVRPVLRITEPLARDRGLDLVVDLEDPDLEFQTDVRRAQQILKNLLSNACKFTPKGSVTMITRKKRDSITFAVRDTGLGIAEEHHETVFEAFRQVEADANRRFGGTGLGLAIARDLARKLGGEVTLTSRLSEGSCFTLELPVAPRVEATPPGVAEQKSSRVPALAPSKNDDEEVAPSKYPTGLRRLVVLADSDFFSQVDEAATPLGFYCARAATPGEVFSMVGDERPAAIVVDLGSKAAAELCTIEELTESPATADIPLHVVGRSHHEDKVRSLGPLNFMKRPLDPGALRAALEGLDPSAHERHVVVVEADPRAAREIAALLNGFDARTIAVSTAAEALEVVKKGSVSCVITDLDLPDAPGHELIRNLNAMGGAKVPSVIIYTNREISEQEEAELMRYSDAIILKGPRSVERLLDEVTLFLHRVQQESPPMRARPTSSRVKSGEPQLVGRRVMLLEDDVRSVFALTNVLEEQGVELTIARNANEALALLQDGAADVELILMDLMLPEMDGLEATRLIRQMPGRVGRVPIIALTAKTMADDRDACLAAGANDYVSKPIEVNKLVSLMRIWLSR